MRIINRKGEYENVDLNRIIDRIQRAKEYSGLGNENSIDAMFLAIKVINSLKDGITTSELDAITYRECMNMSLENPKWAILGSRIAISNFKKNFKFKSFLEAMRSAYKNTNKYNGKDSPLIQAELLDIIEKNEEKIQAKLDSQEIDFKFDFFGFKTLEKTYFLKLFEKVHVETLSFMFMRVSLGIWKDNLEEAFKTYDMMAEKRAIHATPTLFNAGTNFAGMSSCFLLGTEDSIDGIYETLKDCASISKYSGGIGVHISNIRAKYSYINSTGGHTDGIKPMMDVFNYTARYVNQCFTPETIIYTNNGPKEIQFIDPKIDLVITHDGTFKKVNKVFCREVKNEKLQEIKPMFSSGTLKCTGVHEIAVHKFTSDIPITASIFNEMIKKQKIKLEFIPASEIQPGYLVCFPIPKFDKYPKLSWGDFGDIIDKFKETGTNCQKLTYASDKTIMDFFQVFLTEEIMYTDQNNEHTDKCSLFVFNKKAADVLRFLLLRFGIMTRQFVVEIQSKNENVKFFSDKAWRIEMSRTAFIEQISSFKTRDEYVFEHDGKLFVPVVKNTTFEYTGKVYDLNVEGNHNYLTENGLVHNSGKRMGSIAMYLEPWHADILEFLTACRNNGKEHEIIRDLFFALWIPDLFMNAVTNDEYWYLMSPDECPGLPDAFGTDFEDLYKKYVSENKFRSKVKARDIWNEILMSQKERGMPYMSYKDHVNRKNNQTNIGTIKSSNLCNEINEYSDANNTAVCNLGSLVLQSFVETPNYNDVFLEIVTKPDCGWCDSLKVFLQEQNIPYTIVSEQSPYIAYECSRHKTYPKVLLEGKLIGGFTETLNLFRPKYNFKSLGQTVKQLVRNIDAIIDINYYATKKSEKTNLEMRPMGIGVQGLADTFIKMWIPYESQEAIDLNKLIFETIYFYAMEESLNLAKIKGKYSFFDGSPLSKGLFQFDLWKTTYNHNNDLWMKYSKEYTNCYSWENLRTEIQKFGVRNSLLIALMPTASTSQIMGSTEAFEPISSCMYVRRTLAGEFTVMENSLINKLTILGLWNTEMKQRVMFHRGSIQNIAGIPKYIKNLYKTVWEISKKHMITMSADRGAFVCQSQSFNIYMDNFNMDTMTMVHMFGWKQGLKTGSYYIRTRAAANAQTFTIDPKIEEKFKKEILDQSKEGCLTCSS